MAAVRNNTNCTMKVERDNTIPFRDAKGSFTINVYRKPTHTDQYSI